MKKLLLLFLLVAGGVSTASADDMYIVGDAPFGGWKTNAGAAMTEDEDVAGLFTYEYTPASDVTLWFCIASSLQSTDADWENFNPNSYRPTSNGTTFVQFEPMTLSSQDGANSVGMSFKGGVTYTFQFTKSTKELIVFSSEVPGLYLRSNLDATESNSHKTWDAAFSGLSDYKFTYEGWNSEYKKLHYTYNVTSTQLATMITNGESDLKFRIQNDDNSMPQMRPNGNYTFTFSDGKYSASYDGYSNNSNFTGTGSYFQVSHSSVKASKYKISVYVAVANWGRTYSTSVEIVSMPVTIGSTGKATFCSSHALNFSGTGISAYTITESHKETGVLTTSSALTEVPANTGLYLEGTAKTYDVPVLESASSVGTNMLVGVLSDTPISQTATVSETEYTNYILTINTVNGSVATPKFYKVNGEEGNTVLAGKAYLQIRTEDAARESFWFDEDVTAIEKNVSPALNESAVYDLQGRKVMNPAKGLYIVNGKKVIK